MSDLSGGFTQAPQQSARAFREVLEATARPGRTQALEGAAPPLPLSPAAGAVLLTLVDQSTRLYIAPSHDTPEIRHWIAFHCGAPLAEAGAADFALGSWEALQPVARFAIGTPDYPDRSATLIVECDALAPANARLTGPGIETETLAHLPETSAFAANHAGFPLGFDCLFTARDQVLGLPRSTKVEAI